MTEPTDAAPLNVIDLMRVVMDADNETRGVALRGTTNWAAHIGKAVQNAVLAKWGTPPGWLPFPLHLQNPDGRTLRTSAYLLERHGYKECSVSLRNMADVLLATTPQPTQGQSGAVPLTPEQITAAAKKLAECMEYPWDHMPEQGRAEMRKHARAVIAAANGSPPPTA